MKILNKKIIYFFWVLFFAVFITLILHESFHILTALYFGKKITFIGVYPGYQIYPEFGYVEWNGEVGRISYEGFNNDFQRGLVMLMGSFGTMIVGYIFFGVLFWKKVKNKYWRLVLFSFSLITLDFIAYTLLPLIGLRHGIFVGGEIAEPILGAELMGINRIYVIVLALISLVFVGCLSWRFINKKAYQI